MDQCEHGEGTECATLDACLNCCADLLHFTRKVRQWGRNVFAGRIAFDADADQLWRAEAAHLFLQGNAVMGDWPLAEVPCWDLSGQSRLEAALWNLHQLRDGWVTPKLAVGPSARQGYPGSAAERKAFARRSRRCRLCPPIDAGRPAAKPAVQANARFGAQAVRQVQNGRDDPMPRNGYHAYTPAGVLKRIGVPH